MYLGKLILFYNLFTIIHIHDSTISGFILLLTLS